MNIYIMLMIRVLKRFIYAVQLNLRTLNKLSNGYIKLLCVGMFVLSISLRFGCTEVVEGSVPT